MRPCRSHYGIIILLKRLHAASWTPGPLQFTVFPLPPPVNHLGHTLAGCGAAPYRHTRNIKPYRVTAETQPRGFEMRACLPRLAGINLSLIQRAHPS